MPSRHGGGAPLPPELSELRVRVLAAVQALKDAEEWAAEWVAEETCAAYRAQGLRELLVEVRHLTTIGVEEVPS